MQFINFLITDVIGQAPIFLGLIAFFGLLLQKRDAAEVLEGTIKTIIGVVILLAGVDLFVGSLVPQLELLRSTTGIAGVMPDNQAPYGVAALTYATQMSLIFVFGFIIHIFLVRVSPWRRLKNVFLTGHIMMFVAGFWTIILVYTFEILGTPLIVIGSILTGFTYTIYPAMARPYTDKLTDGEYTLGHMFNCAVIIGDKVGGIFKSSKKSSDLELPGILAVFSDYSILLSVMMPIIYIIIGVIIGPSSLETLTGGQNWVMYQTMQGVFFAGSIMIVLYGVRTFLAAIMPAFEGISSKVLPGAIPGFDCPVFYPYAPIGAIIGFLGHTAGAILSTVILIAVGSPIVSIPSAIYVFFEGSLAGVFGDRRGGWKGALLAGLVVGLITHLSVVPLYYLQGTLGESGVLFGGTDFLIFAPIIYLVKWAMGLF